MNVSISHKQFLRLLLAIPLSGLLIVLLVRSPIGAENEVCRHGGQYDIDAVGDLLGQGNLSILPSHDTNSIQATLDIHTPAGRTLSVSGAGVCRGEHFLVEVKPDVTSTGARIIGGVIEGTVAYSSSGTPYGRWKLAVSPRNGGEVVFVNGFWAASTAQPGLSQPASIAIHERPSP